MSYGIFWSLAGLITPASSASNLFACRVYSEGDVWAYVRYHWSDDEIHIITFQVDNDTGEITEVDTAQITSGSKIWVGISRIFSAHDGVVSFIASDSNGGVGDPYTYLITCTIASDGSILSAPSSVAAIIDPEGGLPDHQFVFWNREPCLVSGSVWAFGHRKYNDDTGDDSKWVTTVSVSAEGTGSHIESTQIVAPPGYGSSDNENIIKLPDGLFLHSGQSSLTTVMSSTGSVVSLISALGY